MKRVKISALTKRELDSVVGEANFTEEQLAVFNELNKDRFYDYAIMRILSLPARKFYELKKIVLDKVERISLQFGYDHAIGAT
jgi:hypothetical protein